MTNFGIDRSGAASGTGTPTGAISETIIDAKGDLIAGTAADVPGRLAVGANNTRLVADSAQTTGLKYVADTTNYAIAAKGDLLVGTAASTAAAHTVGSDSQVLVADSTQTDGLRWADPASRGALGGCQFTWVSTTSLTLGAGKCRDDADTETMKLASATTMSALTVGWVVGNNQPKVRTGVTLSNGMTLHAYVIKRVDTGVVDWFLTDEASAPTLPTSYTKSRRVASIRFGAGVQTIPQFIQDGDYFRWAASILDVNVGTPGAAAVSRTLTVPTGINVFALMNVVIFDTAGPENVHLSDLAANDEAANGAAAPLSQLQNAVANVAAYAFLTIRTNTSAQVRSRVGVGAATCTFRIATLGWTDIRGRDA